MNGYELSLLYRNAANVQRYHTCRMLRQQTLAAHTHGVLMLILQVYPDCRKELLVEAMHHDLPEFVTGDIPAPVKRNSAMLKDLLDDIERHSWPLYRDCGLQPHEVAVLRWADLMELVLWCFEEIRMGNTYAAAQAKTGLAWLEDMTQHLPHAVAMEAQGVYGGAVQEAKTLNINLE